MPFFENSSNFTISGGTFNTISGDLNQYVTNHSTSTYDSYNNSPGRGPNGPNHPYYHPYGSQPPRTPPASRPPQSRYQEQGPFGHAQYNSNMGGRHYGGYEEPNRFGESLRSPQHHVEIVEGEFNDVRRGDPNRYHSATEGRGDSMNSPQGRTDTMSGVDDGMPTVEEIVDDDESPSDAETLEGGPTPTNPSAAAAPATLDSLPSAVPRPPTAFEKIRASLAEMEIDDMQQGQATASLKNLFGRSRVSAGKQRAP